MLSFSTIIKGFIVGGTMMVPGVSGGSMAMVLGIYDYLISSLGNLFKDFKNNLIFLLQFGISGILGIVLCAKPIMSIIDRFPIVSMFFFFGLVFGSVPMLFNKARTEKLTIKSVIWFILGLAIVISFMFLPKMQGSVDGSTFSLSLLILQLFTGVVVAIGFILPGISTSYLLLLLGTYEYVMEAISTLNILSLIPFVVGFVAGVLLLTKLLDILMKRFPGPTYLMILGFLVGSIIPVYPGNPKGIEIPLSILFFIVGAVLIYFVSMKEEKD